MHRFTTRATRWGVALTLGALGSLVGAAGAQATTVSDSSPSSLPTTPPPLPELPIQLPIGLPTGLPTGLPSLPVALPTGLPKGLPAGSSPSSSPSTAAVGSPVGSFCLIPTGGSSPAVLVSGGIAGQDLAKAFTDQFRQLAAPCPGNAVPAGDDLLLAAEATVQDLLGLCVRVTSAGPPIQTMLVVLGTELIKALTDAGVPLESLVVPCPGASSQIPPTTNPSPGGGNADDSHNAGPASAIPHTGSGGHLAFTGANAGMMVALGTLLHCAGTLLVRFAQVARRRP